MGRSNTPFTMDSNRKSSGSRSMHCKLFFNRCHLNQGLILNALKTLTREEKNGLILQGPDSLLCLQSG